MRIARLGELNREKPVVIVSDTEAVLVDNLIKDFNRVELENGAISKLEKADLSSRPKVKIADFRIGSPVVRPTKVICVGLNYARGLILMDYWTQNPEVLTQIGFEAKIFKFNL